MPAYLIATIDVHDPERYELYKRGVPALIAHHGGEYLARGGETEVFEGEEKPGRVVLLRFPDRAAIRAFLDDPDYRPLAAIRHASATSSLVAVDGL